MNGKKGDANLQLVQLEPVSVADLAKRLAPKPGPEIDPNLPEAANNEVESQQATGASRPAQRNVVLPCFSRSGRERVFAELALFFELHPSRFFLLDLRREYHELKVFMGEPVGDAAGSQLVIFEAGPDQIDEICGLLRSHVLIGVQTELALLDGDLLPDALAALLPISDAVLVESHLFDHLGGSGWGDGRSALFNELLQAKLTIADSSWLRLSALREELRRAFDQRGLVSPQSIEISYVASESLSAEGTPTVAILLAGWCCARLGADELVSSTKGATAQMGGQKLEISFMPVKASKSPPDSVGSEVVGLTLVCKNGSIRISLGNGEIRTEVEADAKTHSERVWEQESDTDRWRRYFLIGESLTNYRGSLALALPLFR